MLLFAGRRKKKKGGCEGSEINKQMETKIENGDGRDRLRSDEQKPRQISGVR